MANELKFIGLDTDTGLTLTAQIYGEDGVQVGGAIAATEVGSTAIYTADMPVVGAATYAVRFFNGSTVVGSGQIEWNGTEEVTARDLETDIATVDTVVDAILVDTNELQTNQGNFATATGFATPADVTAAVAPLATQASVDVIDGNVDAILVDTNELQTNQGNFATATGFATPADVTSAVAPLATQTSVDVIDGNVDAILADTNELQTNQGNFATATGFATPADVPTVGQIADAVWDEPIADHGTAGSFGAQLQGSLSVDVSAIADAVWDEAIADHQSVGSTGLVLNSVLADTNELQTNQGNFATATGFATPADVTAAVAPLATQTSVDVVDANVDAILADTNELQTNAAAGQYNSADVSGLPTAAEIADAVWDENLGAHAVVGSTGEALNTASSGATDLTPVLTAISNLNDLSAAEVNAQVDGALADYDGPTNAEMTAAFAALNDISASDVYTEFTTGSNEDAFKADVSSLVTSAELDITEAALLTAITNSGGGGSLSQTAIDADIDNSTPFVDIETLDYTADVASTAVTVDVAQDDT